jgi:hypothetical protein
MEEEEKGMRRIGEQSVPIGNRAGAKMEFKSEI